ncbi:MAG: NAD-dependent epimerase/dehydratase family protein [Candidatus Baltobacteraceae bacterium]
MVTILGAGGPIGNELTALLSTKATPLRLVARHPKAAPGVETVAADLADPEQTLAAVTGSEVACLLVGLKYDLATWRELWPRIMGNTIDACKRTGTKLLFFDNVYMYGSVEGPMTEATPYRPCSKKGEIRARIATALMDEVRAGNLTAMIARSADFYGPNTKNGVPNVLMFEPFAKRGTASWLVDANVPHSLTFTPDAARGVAMLIERESAWNQIWHLPTAPDPLTGKAFIQMAAEAFGVPAKYRVLNNLMLRVAALFDPVVRESLEMLYQNAAPYLFDSTKFATEFGFAGTPYAAGIHSTAASYKA